MHILIGTKNAYKVREMTYFLDGIPCLIIHPYSDLGCTVKVEEDQDSLMGNAKKKAREISKATNYYVLASDGGVDIPGLGDKWDILKNQRTVGENSTDIEKVNKLLQLMDGLQGEDRKAEYHLALALALNGKIVFTTEGVTDRGYIVDTFPKGDIPLYQWMGHIWYYPELKKTYTTLNDFESSQVRRVADKIKGEIQKAVMKIRSHDLGARK